MTRHLSVTVTYDDLSITGTVATETFDGSIITELVNRCTAGLLDAYEALAIVSNRLDEDDE